MIIGNGGSGKTTLARALSKILALPVYHLDEVHWYDEWQEIPKSLFLAKQEHLVAQESWIIDGLYRNSLAIRLARADTVIFLDLPRSECIKRIILRTWYNYGSSPAGGCPKCAVRFNRQLFKLLYYVWGFDQQFKPVLSEKMKNQRGNQRWFHLQSVHGIAAFLDGLATSRRQQ